MLSSIFILFINFFNVYIKGGTQVKGIWELDPEANIWVYEEWAWEVEKKFHSFYRSSKMVGWLNLEY